MSYEERVSLDYGRMGMSVVPQTLNSQSSWIYWRWPDAHLIGAYINDYPAQAVDWPDPGAVIELYLRRGLAGEVKRVGWFETPGGGVKYYRWILCDLTAYPGIEDRDLLIRFGDWVYTKVIRAWSGKTGAHQVDLLAHRSNAMLDATDFTNG